MRRRVSWFDMFGFYVLLPAVCAMGGWISHAFYWKEGKMEFWIAGLLFYGFTCFLLCSSIGIFFVRLMDNVGKAIENAFCDTWEMMVDTVIKAQGSR